MIAPIQGGSPFAHQPRGGRLDSVMRSRGRALPPLPVRGRGMTQLDLGRLGVWGHLDSLAAPDAIAYARRAEELGYGTLWVPETVGREPIALLALLAGATDAINLGTSIVNIWGRDAQSARMAAQTIAEASGGRFVLGLGVSHPHLAEKLRGHRFARPLSRMREYLAAYRAAIYRGPTSMASRAPADDRRAPRADGGPGGNRCRWRPALSRHRGASRLDARAAGCRRRWAPPQLAVTLPVVIGDPETARRHAPTSSRTCARRPTRRPGSSRASSSTDWEPPGSDRLVDAMVAIGSVDLVRERIGAMLASGADHVAIIPLAHDGTTEHAATLEGAGRRMRRPRSGWAGRRCSRSDGRLLERGAAGHRTALPHPHLLPNPGSPTGRSASSPAERSVARRSRRSRPQHAGRSGSGLLRRPRSARPTGRLTRRWWCSTAATRCLPATCPTTWWRHRRRA